MKLVSFGHTTAFVVSLFKSATVALCWPPYRVQEKKLCMLLEVNCVGEKNIK